MRVALIGYGRMGKEIEALALDRGHALSIIDPKASGADFKEVSAAALQGAQVCIDFTHPGEALKNLRLAARHGCGYVMGTTGWYHGIDEARRITAESRIGFIYASNFSLGVNLFFRMVKEAAKIADKFEQYDVAGFEVHHRKKADSPSGTARSLAGILIDNIRRKKEPVFDLISRPVEPHELHFASLRCGHVPGTHEVCFDSEADSISLKHTARNRQGFAAGAVAAAEWVAGKSGFFTIDDFIEELLKSA